MIVNMVAVHYHVPQKEFIDKLSQDWLTRYEHTEALEYETTSFHPTENITWDDASTEQTKQAVLLFNIMYSRNW